MCKPFPIKVCWGWGSQAQSVSEKRILKSPFLPQCLYGNMATISHRPSKPLNTACLYTRGGRAEYREEEKGDWRREVSYKEEGDREGRPYRGREGYDFPV